MLIGSNRYDRTLWAQLHLRLTLTLKGNHHISKAASTWRNSECLDASGGESQAPFGENVKTSLEMVPLMPTEVFHLPNDSKIPNYFCINTVVDWFLIYSILLKEIIHMAIFHLLSQLSTARMGRTPALSAGPPGMTWSSSAWGFGGDDEWFRQQYLHCPSFAAQELGFIYIYIYIWARSPDSYAPPPPPWYGPWSSYLGVPPSGRPPMPGKQNRASKSARIAAM